MSPSITACEHDRRNRHPGKATAGPFPYKTNVLHPPCLRHEKRRSPKRFFRYASHENAPCHPANIALPENAFTLSKKPVPAFFFLYPDQTTFPYVPEPDRHRISVMVKARCLGYSSLYRHVPDNEETR